LENLLVMKFGGTSVGSAERMKAACDLIATYAAKRPVTAVVSAMSKITDLLLETTRLAEAGDGAAIDGNLTQLATRHLEAAKELIPAAELKRVSGEVTDLVNEFRRIVNGIQMLGYRPARAVDEAIAVGERLSALLVSEHLRSRGLTAHAVNAAEAVVTDAVFNAASPLMSLTREKAQARLLPVLRGGGIPIVTGFNGATVEGWPTTLGRGGSDFSASILAAALEATELWIWTDVDGIMTADPRLVPDAKILDEITYGEAAELAWAGAKVLHPRTIAPLVESGIPVL
jgi:aspartate kinase